MIFWILHIITLGLIAYLSFRKLKSSFHPVVFWLGMLLKLTAGIILGHIFYEYYGSGDTIYFFDLANNGNQISLPNQPRTSFFVSALKPLVWLTGGSYWIVSLWLSLFSFLACWYATILLVEVFPFQKNLVAICLLFIPTIIFWSSGVMKDTLSFAAMVASVTVLVKFHKHGYVSIQNMVILLLSSILLFKIKHYLLIVLLIFGGALVANWLLNKIEGRVKWILTIAVLGLALVSTQLIHPYLKITRIAQTVYENNQAIIKNTNPEDQLDLVINDAKLVSVLREVPKAIHIGLFRPSVIDNTVTMGWIHKIENLILTTLIFLSLLLCFKLKPTIDWPLLSISISCILLLAIMLPLSSPNFGSLVRYKNAYMPFLFMLSGFLPYTYLTSKSSE